ncbi:unnamed protein product [Leuciscus chuanchicus]
MDHAWFLRTVLLLFALPGGWFKPVITPDAPHLVILKGGQLELRCHDDAEASMVQWLREKGRKIDGELKEDGASVIFLTSTQIQHMGRYTCENTQTGENSSIYVYVKDLRNAFVQSMVNGLLVREGGDCTIPCLVTDPAVNHLSLLTCAGTALPAGLTYITHPQRGITIRNVSKAFDGCYICAGQMDDKPVKSSHYNLDVRPVGRCLGFLEMVLTAEHEIHGEESDLDPTPPTLHIPKPTHLHPLIPKPTPKPTHLHPLIPKPTPKPTNLHP